MQGQESFLPQTTGQYYLRARYYNPVLGQFMQKDSYWGDGLNLYAYCDNNPVLYYDLSGYIQLKEKDRSTWMVAKAVRWRVRYGDLGSEMI